MIVEIKKRSLFGRILKIPKMFRHNWEFTAGCKMNYFERLRFCFDMIMIILKA